jgi:hypothetical protein
MHLSILGPLSPDPFLRKEKGEFNYADLSIYKSHVAFYLKFNVQKFRDLAPISMRRGAGGEVNVALPEETLQLSILG